MPTAILPSCLQGLCYRGPGTLEVFFACEGHFQKLVQGPNPAQHVWEEPGSEGCPDFVKVRCSGSEF